MLSCAAADRVRNRMTITSFTSPPEVAVTLSNWVRGQAGRPTPLAADVGGESVRHRFARGGYRPGAVGRRRGLPGSRFESAARRRSHRGLGPGYYVRMIRNMKSA